MMSFKTAYAIFRSLEPNQHFHRIMAAPRVNPVGKIISRCTAVLHEEAKYRRSDFFRKANPAGTVQSVDSL